MLFEDLLSIVGQEAVFDTGILLAGNIDPNYLRRQLSEWVKTGKLWQLRRGLYALAPPYQKVNPHPFLVANRLVPGSYVSLQSALAYYGLIPEFVATITSVTIRRPCEWENPLGNYLFRHIRPELFFGYEWLQVDREQHAFIAKAEKALLDSVYLQPGGDELVYLESLRLQGMERVDISSLQHMAERFDKPKIFRAVKNIAIIAEEEITVFNTI